MLIIHKIFGRQGDISYFCGMMSMMRNLIENIRDDDSPDVVALQPYFNTIFSFFIEEPSLPDNFYVDIKVLFDNYS